jgi:hypothetical protein
MWWHERRAKAGFITCMNIGLPKRNRTSDPQLRRLMLYPTELWAEFGARIAQCGCLRTAELGKTDYAHHSIKENGAGRLTASGMIRLKRPFFNSGMPRRIISPQSRG